ncbi:unnamed protein product [Musa acuminata subsp. burmannicoides]
MKTPAFARSLRWLIDAGDGSWSRLSSDGGPPAICTWISPRKSGQAQCFLNLERTIPSLVSQAKRANISFFGGGGDRKKHSVAECRSLQDQNSAVCVAARATGALERGLRKQASCADSDTTGSTAQLWWEVNEREEET